MRIAALLTRSYLTAVSSTHNCCRGSGNSPFNISAASFKMIRAISAAPRSLRPLHTLSARQPTAATPMCAATIRCTTRSLAPLFDSRATLGVLNELELARGIRIRVRVRGGMNTKKKKKEKKKVKQLQYRAEREAVAKAVLEEHQSQMLSRTPARALVLGQMWRAQQLAPRRPSRPDMRLRAEPLGATADTSSRMK
jgi:hypothetical protein